jgi:hypothetical protein
MRAFKIRRSGQDYFRVDLPKGLFPDGKRRSVMAGTRREAIDKAQELLEKRKKGLKTEEAKSSLGDFLQRFLSFYRTEGGVALRTWQDYRYHIDENISPQIGAIALKDLKPREVDLWMKSLRERGLGNRTVEYARPFFVELCSLPWNGRSWIGIPLRPAFGRQNESVLRTPERTGYASSTLRKRGHSSMRCRDTATRRCTP